MKDLHRYSLLAVFVVALGAVSASAQTNQCVITDTLTTNSFPEPGVTKYVTTVTWSCSDGSSYTVTTHVWYESGQQTSWAQTIYWWPTGTNGPTAYPVGVEVGTNEPYNPWRPPYSSEPMDHECTNCG